MVSGGEEGAGVTGGWEAAGVWWLEVRRVLRCVGLGMEAAGAVGNEEAGVGWLEGWLEVRRLRGGCGVTEGYGCGVAAGWLEVRTLQLPADFCSRCGRVSVLKGGKASAFTQTIMRTCLKAVKRWQVFSPHTDENACAQHHG